jgi:sigma-B regulation protein RsbU (phosphoserine phosphatase)
MKVLIAEDDPVSRQVLQSYLEQWGHTVVMAENGRQAWELFQTQQPPLVITDWMMPEVDGLELLRRIRAHPDFGYVYVILLTARSRKVDIVQGMDAGADDFLAKPFDRDELRVRVRAGVRVARLEQDLARRNTELRAANQRMKRDLEAAARVQQALLPTTLPDCPDVGFAWKFKPCEELAGDLLGIVPLDARHLALYVLDVSGHGPAAAMLSATVRHFLSPLAAAATPPLLAPAALAHELSRRFPVDAATGQYFTLLYGVLDREQRTFRYVSAGHLGPVHLPHGGEPVLCSAVGLPIGVNPEVAYHEYTIRLGIGDRLYLYSDGIPEAVRADGWPYGAERLLASLQQSRAQSLAESLETLVSGVEQWCGTPHLKDDVSVLGMEVLG